MPDKVRVGILISGRGSNLQALHAYLERHPIGEAFLAPADLEFSRDTMVEPDLMVLPTTKAPLPQRCG